MNWKAYGLLLICSLFTACPGCNDTDSTSRLFEPTSFGEYEFDGAPDLEAPEYVLFGDVEVAQTGVETIRVQNIGRERLKFTQWSVSDRFELQYLEFGSAPDELRTDAYVDIVISYTPVNDEEVRGELVISSNDPDDPVWTIGLFVNAKIPCLETEPKDVVDFGDVELEMESRRTVVFRSCSPNTVTTFSIDRLRGDPEFSLLDQERFANEVSLNPREEIELTVSFVPAETGEFRGFMDVNSNDEFHPERTINLIGEGTPGRCPEAIIVAEHPNRGSETAAPNGAFDAVPLDTISLSAMSSRAFDGRRVEKFEWRVVSRPTDSSADVNNDSQDPINSIFLDLSGEYRIELDVWDSEDIKSCQPASMRIRAVSNEDIHIQLVWDTPNDPNQLDASGSDVDLHLLRSPMGEWNERPFDCFWQNLNPDWASTRLGECETPQSPGCHDDPSLDIDDVDGFGPENINLDNPENADYAVGVHYFSDHGYGQSFVTVRIFIGGMLEKEFLKQRLDDQGFWYVADIEWPSGNVISNGTRFNGFPAN